MVKQNSTPSKKKDPVLIVLSVILAIFCIGFSFSAIRVLAILKENKKADVVYSSLRETAKEQTTPPVSMVKIPATASEENEGTADASPARHRAFSVDIAGLRELYPDMRGWIVLEGTKIDYPIVQTNNNYYYLSHLYNGSSNSNGSIFIDCENNGIFQDDNTVIYGHNMESGIMFAVLNRYKSQDFFEKHPVMTVSTADGDYLVELICGTIEDGNQPFVKFNFDGFEDMEDYVNSYRERSTFYSEVNLQPGDKLLTLCTCTYELFNGRFMLIGKISELYE